jgi:hypothetical protein
MPGHRASDIADSKVVDRAAQVEQSYVLGRTGSQH